MKTRPTAAEGPVYVTGTFDNWSKSTKLVENQNGPGYSITLEVPNQKILFKFVVDGNWVTANNLKVEKDSSGFENNVIYPDDLKLKEDDPSLDFNFISPNLISSNVQGTNNYSWKSDTESSAFTNVSLGDVSPLCQTTDNGNNSQGINVLNLSAIDNDDHSDDFEEGNESLDELVASAQGTISGLLETRTNSLTRISDSSAGTLINIQEGDRQVRYYTSMSLLSRFTKYFK